MAQLLRDNAADARVVDDVAALATAYNQTGIADAAESHLRQREHDLALLAELFAKSDEAVAPLWRRVVTHLGRHRTYYVIAALVLGIVLFRSPEPLPLADGDSDANVVIPTGDNAAALERRRFYIARSSRPLLSRFRSPLRHSTSRSRFHRPRSSVTRPRRPPPPSPLRFTQTGYVEHPRRYTC